MSLVTGACNGLLLAAIAGEAVTLIVLSVSICLVIGTCNGAIDGEATLLESITHSVTAVEVSICLVIGTCCTSIEGR